MRLALEKANGFDEFPGIKAGIFVLAANSMGWRQWKVPRIMFLSETSPRMERMVAIGFLPSRLPASGI